MSRFPSQCLFVASALVLGGVAIVACGDGDIGVGPVGPKGEVGPVEIDADVGAVAGSGTWVEEVRPMSDFDSVVLVGEGSVIVEPGDPALTVEIDDNLLGYIETELAGSMLRIGTTQGVDIDPTASPQYRVKVPILVSLELAGAGEINTSGWETDLIRVGLTGVGDVNVTDLAAELLTVEVSGVGLLTASGTVREQVVSVAGLGEFAGADVASSVAKVACAESGRVTVWATDSIDVEIRDGGVVAYYGSPAVTQVVADSGQLIPLGSK